MYGKLALCFIGLSSGGVIAAGIFAFLAIIGVFPRLIGVTHTRCHVILYETLLILGGTAGNLMDLFHLPLAGAGTAFLALWGLALGVFVGCLVMSLAETLKALPAEDGRSVATLLSALPKRSFAFREPAASVS